MLWLICWNIKSFSELLQYGAFVKLNLKRSLELNCDAQNDEIRFITAKYSKTKSLESWCNDIFCHYFALHSKLRIRNISCLKAKKGIKNAEYDYPEASGFQLRTAAGVPWFNWNHNMSFVCRPTNTLFSSPLWIEPMREWKKKDEKRKKKTKMIYAWPLSQIDIQMTWRSTLNHPSKNAVNLNVHFLGNFLS